MTLLSPTDDALVLAQNSIPERDEGTPLFRRAWHARAFALIVTLVKESHISWPSFQERLVQHLGHQQSQKKTCSPEDIDLQYFDCWLVAVEETLVEEALIEDHEVAQQIEAIRASVAAIRSEQLHAH